jgi:hypothetical protein
MAYDRYGLDWRHGQKKWTVIKAAAGTNLQKDDVLVVTGSGSTVKITRKRSGEADLDIGDRCQYDQASDSIKGKFFGSNEDFEVRRARVLLGPSNSGGATWVAEEGG